MKSEALVSSHPAARWDIAPYLRLDNFVALSIFPRVNRPVRKRPPHTTPQWVPDSSFFFITINCEPRGQNQLCRAAVGDAVLAAFAHHHEKLLWHCRIALLMPDHLHAIIAFPEKSEMKTLIADWKRFLARAHGISWQRDFFDHRLRDHHEAGAKLDYILMNPVRRGLCQHPEDWKWIYRQKDRPPPR